jgi:hypothetical protein
VLVVWADRFVLCAPDEFGDVRGDTVNRGLYNIIDCA